MNEIKKGCISVLQRKTNNQISKKVPDFLTKKNAANAQRIHKELSVYNETPLIRLSNLAKQIGIKDLFVKDESKRFGLNAFKGLGGLYALTCVVCRELGLDINTISFEELKSDNYREKIQKMVFVTATDGNHGKGISWAAGQLGCKAYVYMPVGSSELRAQAIRDVNPQAEVQIMDTNYDDTVRFASSMADKNNWYLVQDTSWEGYEEIPAWIIQGYTTMANEACVKLEELNRIPTHVFVQAGVGAMASGIVGYIADYFSKTLPTFIVVEPENIACIYQSAKVNDGEPHDAIDQDFTIMAGLNCGEPCTIGWPILRDFCNYYIKCHDVVTEYGMRILASPKEDDQAIISGESGAVTTGLVAIIAENNKYNEIKELLNLNEDSVVLCFNTEGDTDPVSYQKIINQKTLSIEL